MLSGLSGSRGLSNSSWPGIGISVERSKSVQQIRSSKLFLRLFRHAHNGERFAIGQRNLEMLRGNVTFGPVERDPGQSRSHFQPRKASGFRSFFAGLENHTCDSPTRPLGMNTESPNPRGVMA